jgi:hypothetical protein
MVTSKKDPTFTSVLRRMHVKRTATARRSEKVETRMSAPQSLKRKPAKSTSTSPTSSNSTDRSVGKLDLSRAAPQTGLRLVSSTPPVKFYRKATRTNTRRITDAARGICDLMQAHVCDDLARERTYVSSRLTVRLLSPLSPCISSCRRPSSL